MQLILLTRTGRKPIIARLGPVALFFGALVLLGLASLSAYVGYRVAESDSLSVNDYVRRWAAELSQQQAEIDRVRWQVQVDLEALTARLGRVQGHVTRLEALGGELVKMAKLDGEEFNFDGPPPVGGPETEREQPLISSGEFKRALAAIERQIQDRGRQLGVLESVIMNRNLVAQALPSGRPIKKGWLSSDYGMRTDPFNGHRQFHKGVDFGGKLGRDVIAVAGGVVTYAGDRSGYGKLVEVNHGNGYITRYAHNERSLVNKGETVKKGQVIAKMGSSGRSTGPHVHFEVLKNGQHIDPKKLIYAGR